MTMTDHQNVLVTEQTKQAELAACANASMNKIPTYDYQFRDNLFLKRDIIKSIQDIHYTIKDDSIKVDELKVLLEYRDKLINSLKEI